ncbi:MAG: hypothetical protein CMH54_05145, partial [Myxococcales bacterium]|nr:hypothetical protein [Myxococcales bacterium]
KKVVVEVVDRKLPTPPKYKRSKRPRTGNHVWVPGHYEWKNRVGKYVWVRGHWERVRAEKKWIKGHYEWKTRGNHRVKIWVAGHWSDAPAKKVVVKVVERKLPTPPKYKRPKRPRNGKHRWVKGHYEWKSRVGKYVWVRGHWERDHKKVRRGKRWVKGHYSWKKVGNDRVKVWVRGSWK